MCRNSVQERSRMKKKIMLFLLAVFLGFALLISAICFFVPKKNQNSRENPTEQQKTEDTAEQTEKEKREKYHFTNLEYIYYINSENETDFEEQAQSMLRKIIKTYNGSMPFQSMMMMCRVMQGQQHFIYN